MRVGQRSIIALVAVLVGGVVALIMGRDANEPGWAQPTLTVGPREVIVSASARRAVGLRYWPDGSLAVLRSGTKYMFIAGNGPKTAKTVGTLDDPVERVVSTSVSLKNPRHEYDHASVHNVFRDPVTGSLLGIYHAEYWLRGNYRRFYSLLGLALSLDHGDTWTDLGEIVSPNTPLSRGVEMEIAGGPYVVVDDYLYVYFRDRLESGASINLAVARARVADVVNAAIKQRTVVPWTKYYDGAWDQPGLGGRSSPLESGNPGVDQLAVSYNDYLSKYVAIASTHHHAREHGSGRDLFYLESADGLSWSPRRGLEDEPGESYAPAIVGSGADPQVAGRQFYVYYVYSTTRGRWEDGALSRRLVVLEGN